MQSFSLLSLLQLCDSFFPTGAFSYSDGLESAVSQELVTDQASLNQWIEHYLTNTFLYCDGLAFWQTSLAFQAEDWHTIHRLDRELTALKPSASVRKSSCSSGKRFLKSCLPLYSDKGLDTILTKIENQELVGNASVVYALIFEMIGVNDEEALIGFGYTRLMGMVSAALRLMSIGQQQAQTILTEQLQQLPNIAKRIQTLNYDQPLESFAPIQDIQQMNHCYLYSRLFRS